jgi:hypothetical protein
MLVINVLPSVAQNPKTNAGKVERQMPAPTDTSKVKSPVAKVKEDDSSNFALATIFGVGAVTQGQFSDVSNGDWAYGGGLTVMYNFMGTRSRHKSPVNVYLGGTFEYLYFGGKSDSYKYDDPYPYNAITNNVTTKISSNVYSLVANLRAEFFSGPIVPFVEVAAGGRMFDGTHRVTIDRSQKSGSTLPSGVTFTPTSKDVPTTFETDFTGTYGFGGGLRLGVGMVRVEIKGMMMSGTQGRYVDPKSVTFDSNTGRASYATKTSTTDMFLVQVGISGNF